MSHALKTIKIKEPYYHREIKNDNAHNSSNLTDCLNVALLIIPNLCKPLSRPIALGAGALRTWTCCTKTKMGPSELFNAALATTCLTATFLGHPLGMLITATQDLGLELSQLLHALRTSQNLYQLTGHCLNVVNDTLYLAIFLKGGLQLTIASLVMQILTGIYKSHLAFSTGHSFKSALQLLTTAFRCHQLKGQINLLHLIKKGSSFSLIKTLGGGATGRVFLARRSDNTLIAVKAYRQNPIGSDCLLCNAKNSFYTYSNDINKLASEAFNIGKKLDHPNIVKIIDQAVQLDDSEYPHTYLMMEYVEEKPEDQAVQEPIKNCLQFLDALKAGFSAGYMYNDFHEGNILVDSQGDLKLIDVDSFKKLKTQSDLTNEDHLKEIMPIIKEFLYEHEDYSEIKASLKAAMKDDELQMEGQKYISEKSPSKYFMPMFEKIAAVLTSYS